MNLRLGALALSCLAVLAVGGVALAAKTKTNTLTGTSLGDPNNVMSLKVSVKKGKAKTVSKVKAENFNYACDDETTTGEKSYTFPGKFKVKKVDGKYVFGGTSKNTADPYWRVNGYLNKGGTSGYVESYYKFTSGNQYCGGNGGANIKK
jgi:hypothetical protein